MPVRRYSGLLLLMLALLLPGCASIPQRTDNSCEIFNEKPWWYRATQASYRRWGVPDHILLAFVHQESGFVDDAKAPRDTLLGFIPWGRVSSAYGYAQALDDTWDGYRKATGRYTAHRADFADAVDFIGWYNHVSNQKLGISKQDSYNLYLAYHEGHGGYRRGTYRSKKWLLNVAEKVRARSTRYQQQLQACDR